jgi:ABC-type xylose transport system permease subunit
MADTTSSPEQRLNRNWTELIQEIRATQTGVQILTGFLLTVPFSDRFADLDDVQRTSFLLLITSSVLTTVLVLAPIAYHRILFRQQRRAWLVEAANQCARAGLLMLAVTMTGVLFLVFDIAASRVLAVVVAVIAAVFFALLWWIAPITIGRKQAPGSN